MTWLRLDDGFPENLKVSGLSDRAFRVHVTAMCYCARNLTDGLLTDRSVKVIAAVLGFSLRIRVNELVAASLWLPDGEGGFTIKDYLHYNPDSQSVKKTQVERREAGKRGAEKRWGDGKSYGNSYEADASGKRHEADAHAPARPGPSEVQDQRPLSSLSVKKLIDDRFREAS